MFQVCISGFFPLWSLNHMHFSCTELCYCSPQIPKRHCALLLHKKQKQQVWAFCHCHFTYFHLKCKMFFVWQRIRCVCHNGESKNMSWKSSRVHCAHPAVFLWAESHPWSEDPKFTMELKKKKSNKKQIKNSWESLQPPPQYIQIVKNYQITNYPCLYLLIISFLEIDLVLSKDRGAGRAKGTYQKGKYSFQHTHITFCFPPKKN